MKPHIIAVTVNCLGGPFAAWHCSSATHYAIGMTPVDAYQTWERVRASEPRLVSTR